MVRIRCLAARCVRYGDSSASIPIRRIVFVSERGGPMTSSNVRKMLTRAGEGLGMPIHPHMLRHGCGFKLANQGIDTRSIQAFMGHSSIASTVIYTEIAPQRFKGFWKD